MKILNLFLLLINVMVLPVTEAYAANEALTNKPVTREFGDNISIKSEVLGADRNLIIHLPTGYAESTQQYPVLYLLDGERHIYHAVIATELLYKAKKIPELIIVAITNKENMRERDLNTESEKFTRFIRSEVMHYVSNNYRTSGLSTLFGHSLAGFYAVDLFANSPELFDNYIAASPPLQGDEIEIYNKILAHKNNKNSKALYFTLANAAAEGNDVANAMTNFVSLLNTKAPNNLNWHYQALAEQTHITTSYLTLFHGISYVLKD